ncbi:MAG TPA: leucine-rich repeat domain-containing protein [Cyclobacteriaceae bacterium]|nr:leucine-rich repeat domain-containing protein [Cyclobacteriaceae bacterium]
MLLLSGLSVQAQLPAQRPVFSNRADSAAYAALDAKLNDRFGHAIGNEKLVDSITLARKNFLDTHSYRWRYTFRQDPGFTPYQSLKSIKNKDSITRISIVGGWRTKLPDSIYMYKNLEALELIDFRLSKLRLKGLKKVKRVSINNNFAKKNLKLPKRSSISWLTIRGDETGKLPKSYANLRKLAILNLSRNNMTSFDEVKMPKGIARIDLSVNNLTTVPSWMGKLQSLNSLSFSNNRIERVEPGIEKIKGLEELSFYRNNLSEIPSHLYSMTSLKVVDLYYNRIPKVSPEIAHWKNVEILYLSNNALYSIPEEIGQLTKLRELYLHHNRLSNLPVSIGNLHDVTILRINNNNMVEWPAGLSQLTQLGNFDCSSNQFESIPITDLDFRNMKILSLGGNPWSAEARKNIDLWVRVLRDNNVVVHIDAPRRKSN